MSKSIAFTEYGSPDVLHLRDTGLPEPGPGQVRIAVRAAGVNPLDHKVRSGRMQQVFPVSFPHVPGAEAAGVVDALGEGVTALAVGDPVLGSVTGGYAEHALAQATRLIRKPDTLSWERAAALPVGAETSYRVLELLDVRPGETLLVHAAAGGVGSVAVQIAVARGIKVIGTASEANHARLRALGATPVTYGDGLAERVRAIAPGGVDAAMDAAGLGESITASVELTGGQDRVVSIVDPVGAARAGVRFTGGAAAEWRGQLAYREALDLLAAGKLDLAIHRSYPLAEAAAAQRESESGHAVGKIVLTV
jgi:NADPH:quinone reductase-like Zn-dependent oxidoreductase